MCRRGKMPDTVYKTEYGIFRVTVNDDIKIDFEIRQKQKLGITVSIGGKDNCVYIKAPLNSTTAELVNLKVKNSKCELTGKTIFGDNTVGMVNLSFEVLRKEAPHIKRVYLIDQSDFECKMNNGDVGGISLALYELMFHQNTWYERHFGAYLCDDDLRLKYEKAKKNFKNEKPEYFSFENEDLQKLLEPIYIETKSWEDFFAKVYTNPKKCEIIFPWYQKALNKIMENVSYARQSWIIDLIDNPLLKNVDFEIVKNRYGGGKSKRKTRKNNNTMYYIPQYPSLSYEDMYNLKYPEEVYGFV